MSWAADILDFPLKTSKEDMMVEIRESLNRERGYYEPVHQQLILLTGEQVYGCREEAEKRLSDLYSQYGRKKNYGIQYKDFSNVKRTKKMADLERRVEELKKKIDEYSKEHSIASFKADFVGCPECKSKLKKVLLKSNKCPLCNTDMRSATTLSTLSNYQNKIKELEKMITEERKKQKAKAETRWLVHAEAYIG